MVCLVFDIPKKKRLFILLGFVFVNHKFFIIIFIVQNTKKRKKTKEGSNPLIQNLQIEFRYIFF